jgi:S-DNA-T family DNA segregation ATPase FtsK/SpoIIIE
MAKKRISKIKKLGKKASGNSWSNRFLRFLLIKVLLPILLLGAIAALIWWQWPSILRLSNNIVRFFGYGLLFIAATIIVLIVQIWRHRAFSFIQYWNKWLGGIILALAAWGLMSFFNNMGGYFGRSIIGFPADFTGIILGILRILALVIIGIFMVAPRASFRYTGRFFAGLGSAIKMVTTAKKRRPASSKPAISPVVSPSMNPIIPSQSNKPPLPSEMERELVPPEMTLKRQQTTPTKDSEQPKASPTPETPTDLKQVAQDVWKKYGQSKDLVTVDGWRLPPIDILDQSAEIEFSDADNQKRAELIEKALSSYGVEAKVVQINSGPTVTQFGVEPGWDRKFKEIKEKDKNGDVHIRVEEIARTRVKVDRITSLSNDLALALAAPTIRIEAPIPGKSVVGIEVPNVVSNMVSMRSVIETSQMQKLLTKTGMAVALGKGAGGEAVVSELTKMPHLLVAGATGSGKTVCLNTIICCLLMHNTPYDVRFIMIDPKRVELTQYNSIPHLVTPVIVDANRALDALRWLCQEMDDRYKKMASVSARHIEGYNKNKQGTEKMPYLVLIVDELADLMMAGFDEVESRLCRLAQLARATGIHLVVATQRPSVDVVTGLIKANFPTRASFAVTSQVDSRTILDSVGAEKLLGRGDMLFMPTEAAKPKRLQGCFLSDPEIDRVVYFWGSQKPEEADKLRMETLIAMTPNGTIGGHPRDPLLEQAKELAKDGNFSTSFLQRRLHIGYPRAARLMEQLQAELGAESETIDEAEEETVD